MTRKTLTTKVMPEVANNLSQTGYSVSDVLNVGLNLFLSLPRKQQELLISQHIKMKKQERVRKLGIHFR